MQDNGILASVTLSKMPAKSPGSKERPVRKPKAETPPRQKHKFEPFTRRIARLKIDPVHTVKGRAPSDDASDVSQSFFRTALEEWGELNLSRTFTSFSTKVNPLSENLPQLLHHRDEIFEILLQHIETEDALALEPLLALTAHLAHDLGQDFETYFSRTVSLLTKVAGNHDAADVIEWCFTCLAWMFKYLSRLLVQDLRPLLRIMKPCLSHRKEYIARFSAESLAFLLRKASVLYPKRNEALRTALTELLEHIDQSEHQTSHGVMSLLVETCLGVEYGTHSGATYVFECLLEVAEGFGYPTQVQEVVHGTLISLVHRTDAAGFRAILSVLLQHAKSCQETNSVGQMAFMAALLEIVVGTRSGTRIEDWKPVLDTIITLTKSVRKFPAEDRLNRLVLSTSALCLQYTPMDQLLPASMALLDSTYQSMSSRDFFAYCTMSADLGCERFHQLLLPRLQQYIITKFSDDEIGLICLLEDLHEKGATSYERGDQGYIESSREWDKSILRCFNHDEDGNNHISDELLAGLSRLGRNIKFPVDANTAEALSKGLAERIIVAANKAKRESSFRTRLHLGWVFDAYTALSRGVAETYADVLEVVKDVPSQYFRMIPFVEALVRLGQLDWDFSSLRPLQNSRAREALLQNLINCSSQMRKASLLLIRSLGGAENGKWLHEAITLLLEICDSEYTHANARNIAMFMRRLPKHQKHAPADPVLQQLIPLFCLGTLPMYHDQTRRDACIALKDIIEGTEMEDTVIEILASWLRSSRTTEAAPIDMTTASKKLSPFECSNLIRVRNITSQAFEGTKISHTRMRLVAEEAHHINLAQIPVNARGLALQALNAMATVAEKRSRLIIPTFLAAQLTRTSHESIELSDTSSSSHTLSPDIAEGDWTPPDRKAFLTLFAEFQNPKVLFRSDEVYERLLDLLSNGNSEIRKLALKAILKWRDPTLRKHEDLLFQIVEEKIANAEIGVVLNTESEDNPVPTNERRAILPILLRLLYGMIVGRSGTYGSQEARRKTILRMLFRMEEAEVVAFLDIALGKLKDVRLHNIAGLGSDTLSKVLLPTDQQYGFLRMLLTLIETLQSDFTPYGECVVDAVLYCTLRSCRQIERSTCSSGGLTANVRRTGLQCVVALFDVCTEIDWEPFMSYIFVEAISPRLQRFALETAQGISILLRLFSTWSRTTKFTPYLQKYDPKVLPTTLQILSIDSAKNEVKAYVLEEILTPLVQAAHDASVQPNVAAEVLSANMPLLLQNIGVVLQNTPPKEILVPTTTILMDLGSIAVVSGATSSIVTLLVDILATSKKQLGPHARGSVLGAIQSLLKSDPGGIDPLTRDRLFEMISRLFSYFRDTQSRLTLCTLLECLEGQFDSQLTELCADLNAVSKARLDEFDYDRRLKAFQQISDLNLDDNSAGRWLPILYNLLYFIRDEDFSIRSNAVSCLKQVIETKCSEAGDMIQKMMLGVLLPALRDGAREDSETVRADMVMLFGLLVKHFDREPSLQNLQVLLVGNDEEASFFSNVLHVQQHRRLRAIRRLVSEVERGELSEDNITHFFLPLLQKFVRDASADESAQNLKGETLATMRKILQWVSWKQFKLIFLRYKSELEGDEDIQKTAVKLLAHAADALISAHKDKHRVESKGPAMQLSYLAASLPGDPKFAQEVNSQLLPKLRDFAHHKDEAEMNARLPVATTAIKLVSLLPANEIHLLSAPIVLDVANVLRSRAQEARDAARATLKETVLLLGPGSLQFVMSELRSALKRGYQLHVLSFTMHALLIALSPSLEPGDLDYCVGDLVLVVMDDIFGAVGQEKDSQDYISSMKEVKSSKSFDSMELLARSTSVNHLRLLIEPIVTLLTGALTAKQTRQVDELLRRLGVGLSRNAAAGSRELLVFAYQAIQSFYKERSSTPKQTKTLDEMSKERLLIQLSSANKAESSSSSPLSYKAARFAIDLVRSTLLKHDDLLTPENVYGFLAIIGDALIEGQEDVKVSALRLLSAIIKLRMPELDQNAPVYVREAVKVVQNANNTNDGTAQAALKLISAVLRERKNVKVRDSDVADLLHRIIPDLEEPERQGVSFNFVRAVMSRKYQLPEIYEVVDKIGVMMVTNQTRGARDLARGVYVHFLLEYPQSSSRWTKQQKFLIKNLEYDYPEGRESVMEAVNMLLNKISGHVGQQLVSAFFVPIVLRMANEDHEGCRALAGALLGRIFQNAEPSTRKQLLQPLESWVEQTENPPLTKLGMQAFAILFETVEEGLDAQVKLVCEAVENALKSPASEEGDLPGEALKLLSKLCESRPNKVLTQKLAPTWSEVRGLLRHQFPSIQQTAVSLIGTFFGSCKPEKLHEVPLASTYGLGWDGDALREVLKASVRIIKHAAAPTELHQQTVPVLLFLGRCLEANKFTMEIKSKPGVESVDSSSAADDSDSLEVDPTQDSTTSIPAIHYLFHQLTLILRYESPSHSTASLQPKTSALQLLSALIPSLSATTLTPSITQNLLLPLIHLTSPQTHPPHSPDPTFTTTYTALIESAQELMSALQSKLGDKAYISAMTEASKIARERREERRRKRAIERVAEPERAAEVKRRKGERKKERKREVGRQYGVRRRGRGY